MSNTMPPDAPLRGPRPPSRRQLSQSSIFSPLHTHLFSSRSVMMADTDTRPSTTTLKRGESSRDAILKTHAVELNSVAYTVVFAGLYGIHAVCALYCFGAALLFQALPGTVVTAYVDFYGFTLPSKYFGTIAVAHNVVGGIHCAIIAIQLIKIVCRPLNRFAVVRAAQARTASAFRTRSVFSSPHLQHRVLQKVKRAVRGAYNAVFARTGFFGVDSRHFDSLFLLREVSDVIMQTYQAYIMCLLLPRPTLNRFYVATLVINCWSSPLIHRFVKNVPLRRVWCHVCDMVLDLISAVGVPLLVTITYLRMYDPTTGTIPNSVWWKTESSILAIIESPLILFGSWIDALNRLGFSISLLLSLDDVKLLVKHRSATDGKPPQAIVPEPEATTKTPFAPTTVKPGSRCATVFTMTHRLLVVYGFAVLGVQLHAELRPDPSSSCVLPVRPWLISQPACALISLNCFKHKQRTGNAADFDAVFGDLNPQALEQIEIRHCSHVEILPVIQKFQNLIGIKLYNSSIIRWDEDAALTERHHKRLRTAHFARIQFPNSTIPPGLLSHEFPLLLRDVEFSVTNLKWIPPDLHERWPPGRALCLEFSELTEFPLTFAKAQLIIITLHHNQITSVPAEAFTIPNIALTGNPITYLPEDVDATSVVGFAFFVDETNLTALPSWLEDETVISSCYVMAGRTPLCENVILKANASELEAKPWLKAVDCSDTGEPAPSVYPLAWEVRDDEVW